MLKKLLVSLAFIIIVLAVVTSMQPSEFKVSRSATISATPDKIFAQVNNLRRWENWSPWAKLDPNAKITYEGPEAGKGAISRWDGNHEVGKGSMTITESRPSEFIQFQLDFLEPFEGTNMADFTFKPEGNQTNVTWTMSGHKNFIAKAMGLVMNCDKMIGDNFDKGLAQLKTVAEGK